MERKKLDFAASLYAVFSLYTYFRMTVFPDLPVKPLSISLTFLTAAVALTALYFQTGTYIYSYIGRMFLWIFASLLGTATLLGAFLEMGIPLTCWGGKGLFVFLTALPGVVCIIKSLLVTGFEVCACFKANRKLPSQKSVSAARLWLKSFLLILLAWLPVWLAYYPGLWNYDPWQVDQVIEGVYSKHHPLLHTLLLGGLYRIGWQNKDPKTGLILYIMIQSGIMAAVFAYTRTYIAKREGQGCLEILTLLFFALFPVNSILAISTTKDVLFSGFFLLLIVVMKQYLDHAANGEKRSLPLGLILCVLIVLVILFRNNAKYAIMINACICFALSLKRHLRPKIGFLLCVSIVAATLCDGALTRALDAKDGSIREVLSVPCQQQARIYSELKNQEEDGMPLQEKDYEAMRRISDFNLNVTNKWDINGYYNKKIADYAKDRLCIQNQDELLRFLKLSGWLFVRYPLISLDSFLLLTKGYWYIGDVSHSEIYGKGTPSGKGYLITEIYPGYGITRESKMPVLFRALEELFSNNSYQKIPLVSLLFSPAFYFWLQLFCLFVFLSRKRYDYIALSSLIIAYYTTLLLGPCVLIRYAYPLVVTAPVYLSAYRDAVNRPEV